MIPPLSNEAELSQQFAAMTAPISTFAVNSASTSTSLACATTGAVSVSASQAQNDIESFCGQEDHLVPINPSAGTSQNFVRLNQNSTVSVSWASGCTGGNSDYTLNQEDCRTYLNETVNNCETDSSDKHGGNVTVDCIVYAVIRQTYVAPPAADNPTTLSPSAPASTVPTATCASATPNAIMYNRDDAKQAITKFCEALRYQSIDLADPKYGFCCSGSGRADDLHVSASMECCSTSEPGSVLGLLIKPSSK